MVDGPTLSVSSHSSVFLLDIVSICGKMFRQLIDGINARKVFFQRVTVMKISEILAASHPLLDSVTFESFAKDCGVCLVVGKRLVKDATTESGFGQEEKLMPVLSLVPKGKNRLKQLKAELLKQKNENIAAYAKQVELQEIYKTNVDPANWEPMEQELQPIHSHEMPLGKNLMDFAIKFGIDTEPDDE